MNPALEPRPALSKHGCSFGTWNLELPASAGLELPASAGLALPASAGIDSSLSSVVFRSSVSRPTTKSAKETKVKQPMKDGVDGLIGGPIHSELLGTSPH